MRGIGPWLRGWVVFLAFLLVAPQGALGQGGDGGKPFKQEELEQLLAPIALYPDSLLAQIFMASTYPLEVVQAGRWVRNNQGLKGDALTAALEKENWDPSVKSLINFPQVLEMMNEKLDWTQKLGDAFLGQQKDVMGTVQRLRARAEAEGNLKSTKEQKVVVEKETKTIVIESANPQVVYVPTYNPTVVYGAWAYPAYPPYAYYPPGYAAGAALFSFGMGVAMGAAWGYAWGNCNWGGGDVNVNIDRNTNINNNIDRSKYQKNITGGQGGRGEWKHDPEHRKGVSYRDQGTAQRFDRAASRDGQSRDAFRGRAEAGRKDIAAGDADRFRAPSSGGRQETSRPGNVASMDSTGGRQSRDGARIDSGTSRKSAERSAFDGYERGSQTRDASSRGRQSLSSSRASGGGGGGPSRSSPSGGGRAAGGARGGGGRGR